MSTLMYTRTYSVVTCCRDGCGITFAMDDGFIRQRKEDHAWWYCPNGHRQYWPQENEEEKLRRTVNNLRDQNRWLNDQYDAADRAAKLERRRAAAARGQLTKIKNKVANGVCPVPGCKRSFTNVLQHLRNEHPDYHKHEEEK